MGKFLEQDATDETVHYVDVDGDILEFLPTYAHDGVVLDSGDGVVVAKEDLVEFFERVAEMVDVEGTFVPKSENEVTTLWGRTRCGVGESEASVINGVPAETVRELAANLLSIADTLDKEVEWQKTMERLDKKAVEEVAKKAHDDLRTSEIALEALELYKKRHPLLSRYNSWDDTHSGTGASDDTVRSWIRRAEEKRKESRQPQVGDLVRVAADAETSYGSGVYFGRSVIGEVSSTSVADVMVRTRDPLSRTTAQMVAPKSLTVIVRADELPQLREAVLSPGLDYADLTDQQQHLVDEIIATRQEKGE